MTLKTNKINVSGLSYSIEDSDTKKMLEQEITRAETTEQELREEIEKLLIGGNNIKDITDTIIWTNGAWCFTDNIDTGSSFIKNTYKYSNKIDISNYDKITLSGLWNGGPASTNERRYPTITFFGDGNPIKWEDYEDGVVFTIFRNDYSEYSKLEIVINAFQSTETYVPNIKVVYKYDNGIYNELDVLNVKIDTNTSKVSKLNDIIVGTNDEEVVNNIKWTNGAWNFQQNIGTGSPFIKNTYKYSNKIDISIYDSVKISGLWNGSSTSSSGNTYATITFFGDGNPISYKQYKDGETFIVWRKDYSQYDKLEIVLNARQDETTYIPSVKVSKKGISSDFTPAKRIVICGDSLSGNESSLLTYELNSIAKSQGYEIVRNSMGGENIIGNLTRNGGIGIRVSSDFTMPSNGSVNIILESAWIKSTGEYAQNPYNNLSNRDVIIAGVEGKLTRLSETSYTFTRNDEGDTFNVGTGTIFYDKALWTCRNYPHIWFTGQNGGYDTEEEWADMINMAARNFGENFIVCSTALTRTTPELIKCATKRFGNKYINLRAYTEGQAVFDGQRFGLIDETYSSTDYASLFWPGTDKVHQNNLLSYLWAVLMWNTLIDLGYVVGEHVSTGEFFVA